MFKVGLSTSSQCYLFVLLLSFLIIRTVKVANKTMGNVLLLCIMYRRRNPLGGIN